MYICLKRLKVGHEIREPGSPIPEAEGWDWRIRRTYIENFVIADRSDTGRLAPAPPLLAPDVSDLEGNSAPPAQKEGRHGKSTH